MSLVNNVKTVLFGNTPEQHTQYRCTVCQATFDSTEPTAETAACEHCGSNNVQKKSPDGE